MSAEAALVATLDLGELLAAEQAAGYRDVTEALARKDAKRADAERMRLLALDNPALAAAITEARNAGAARARREHQAKHQAAARQRQPQPEQRFAVIVIALPPR
jgi:hypothetical protein